MSEFYCDEAHVSGVNTVAFRVHYLLDCNGREVDPAKDVHPGDGIHIKRCSRPNLLLTVKGVELGGVITPETAGQPITVFPLRIRRRD